MDASVGAPVGGEYAPDRQQRMLQAQDVAMLLQKMDKIVTDGSIWHLVSMAWIDKWQKYTYFDLLDGESQSALSE